MPRRLLVVETSFAFGGRGIVLAPLISIDELSDVRFETPIEVELRSVDGRTRRTSAILTVPRISDMKPPYKAAVRLPDEASHDVPAGAEVWTVD